MCGSKMPSISETPDISHLETGWSTRILRAADRALPRAVFEFLVGLGGWVALALFRDLRRNSRDYLAAVLGRAPSLREIWRHYRAFMAMHMLRLRVGAGRAHACQLAPGGEAFTALMTSKQPALLGAFHVGNSDLLGFCLGQYRRHVFMIRFRLGDPAFLSELATHLSAWVTFIWVNERENLLFALKSSVEAGGTIAMKCDRVGYSAKLEAFNFLGARRWFPFTIYHLALIFQRPVMFCIGVPGGADKSTIHSSPLFEPDGDSRESNLLRARVHFQQVLTELEALLRANPYLWFNFVPLNPIAAPAPPVAEAPVGAAAPLARVSDSV